MARSNGDSTVVGSPDGIVLTVQDDAEGIAESDLPRVCLKPSSQLAASWAQASVCSSQSSLLKATEARSRLKAGGTGKITVRPLASFCPFPQRITPPAMVRPPRIEWATKCGRLYRSCLRHCCSGIELSRRGRERSLSQSRVRVRSPQICCS
jgi:hypothetical protein